MRLDFEDLNKRYDTPGHSPHRYFSCDATHQGTGLTGQCRQHTRMHRQTRHLYDTQLKIHKVS